MGSEAVPRGQYLWKRGGRYYVRRCVPTHLVPFIGKTELTRSLHTSDYGEARKRADLEIAQMRLAFNQAEAALALAEDTSSNKLERLSFPEINTLVRDWFDRGKRDLLENWSFRATGCNEAGEDMETMRDETLAGIEDRLRGKLISNGPSDPVTTRSKADELLISEGFVARPRKSGRTGKITLATARHAGVGEQSASCDRGRSSGVGRRGIGQRSRVPGPLSSNSGMARPQGPVALCRPRSRAPGCNA